MISQPVSFTPEEEAIRARLGDAPLPRHVAAIMDGNGRWARARAKERLFGHHEGRDTVRMMVRTCRKLKIPFLTLYTFSSENWNRSRLEVEGLMRLLEKTMAAEEEELHQAGVRMRLIGRLDRLPAGVRAQMERSRDRLADNTELTMTLAIDYGGRDELVRLFRQAATEVAAGELDPATIDEAFIDGRLDTAGIPDPELLIRTGGELRISNYLLWQSAYSEFYFTDKLWPEFLRLDFIKALAEYVERDRRFGTA